MIEFVVSLRDNVTSAARMAASSMLELSSASKLAQASLAEFNATASKVKAPDIAPAKSPAPALGGTGNATKGLGGMFKGAMKDVEGFGSKLESLGGPASSAGASISSVAGELSGLAAMGPAAIAVVAAAFVAGAGMIAVAGGKMAIEASEMRESLEASFTAMGKGPDAGKKVMGMLDELSNKLPQTRTELAEWTKQLMSAGVTDMSKLQGQLTAIASAEAIMGSDGAAAASKVSSMFAKIAAASQLHKPIKLATTAFDGMGVSVEQVAAQMGITGKALKDGLKDGKIDADKLGTALQNALTKNGGGALATMGQSLDTMKAKFTENIMKMFEGVNVKPFLAGLKSIVDMFSQSSASGKAMKAIVTAVFNGLFSAASMVFPVIKWMILGVINNTLRIYIALKPAIAAFKELFASMGGAAMVVAVLKTMAVAVGVLFGFLAAGVAIALAPLALLVGAVVAFGAAMSWVTDKAASFSASVIGAISGLAAGATSAASNFISGLVGGIESGASSVISAVENLAKTAVGAMKNALGIHSPSKVMMGLGTFSAMGMAEGMSAGAPQVSKASHGLASAAVGGLRDLPPPRAAIPPDAPSATRAAPSGGDGSGKGKGGVHIDKVEIHIVGAEGGAYELTSHAVAVLFEKIALSQGLGAT